MLRKKDSLKDKIVSIYWIDSTERYVVVSRRINGKIRKKIKPLKIKKGNCYFASIMPNALVQFVYKSAKKLGLRDQVLIFSRGSIRINNTSVNHAVSITWLDWDVGVSFLIPLRLRYDRKVTVEIEGCEHSVRLMELAVLGSLISVRFPSLSRARCNELAMNILARGWKSVGM